MAAFVFSFVLGLCFAFYFIHRGKAQRANQFIRGSRIDTKENVIQQILDKKENSDITIDGPSKRTAKFNICWCMEL
ncbi:hypothetical protein PGH45_19200 [Legionella pneumophila]|nr:hypothetical protein [Legionella pneumophila]